MRVLCGVERSWSTRSGGDVAFDRFSRLEKREISREQGSWADLKGLRRDVK